MTEDTTRLAGRGKLVITTLVPFFEGLEQIVGGSHVFIGDFSRTKHSTDHPIYGARAISSNPPTIRVIAHSGHAKQTFTFSFDSKKAGDVQAYLTTYNIQIT